MEYAYFCARCASVKTDSSAAERLAGSLGLSLWKPHEQVSSSYPEGALACRAAIDGAAVVICQPPVGNDCSWELGYSVGRGKEVYVLGELDPDDWMTKIGVRYTYVPLEPAAPPAAEVHPLDPPDPIHPFEKSLSNYVAIGYASATGQPLPDEARKFLAGVSLLDTSVLVIDDILDGSRDRAGRPSLHRQLGTDFAITQAMVMASRAIDALARVATALDTPAAQRLRIHELVNAYLGDMYIGQQLDLEARRDPGHGETTLLRYRRIISLITGSHVRLGFECGQLLAAASPDEVFGRAGEAIGRTRQMLDDFNDYFDDHHQPFGDFKGGLNRLPEILFKRSGGRREDVLRALAEGRADDARELVLTARTRAIIHEHCEAELAAIDSVAADLDLRALAGDTRTILTRSA